MTLAIKISAAAILALGLSGASLAQGSHDHGHHDHGGKPAADDAPSTIAFRKADAAMMQGMSVGYTGNADIDFRTHMIPHHKGAVDMAKVALAHAKDPETRAMAQAIIEAQDKEIAEMEAWLKANRKP